MLSRLRIIIFTKHLRYIKNLITRQIWMSEDLPGSPISDQYLANSILNICSFCFLGFEYKHTVSLVWNTSTKFLFQFFFIASTASTTFLLQKSYIYFYVEASFKVPGGQGVCFQGPRGLRAGPTGPQGAFRVPCSIFIIAGLEPKLFVFRSARTS